MRKHFTLEDIHKVIYNVTIAHLILKPWANSRNIFSKEWAEMALKTDFAEKYIMAFPFVKNYTV